MKHNTSEPMEYSKSDTKRGVYSDKCLHKKRKLQINNQMLHLKEIEKEEQTKAKNCRRNEIIKLRACIK